MSQDAPRLGPGPVLVDTDSILGAGRPTARALPQDASLEAYHHPASPRALVTYTQTRTRCGLCDDRHRRMRPAVGLYHYVAKSAARVLSRMLTARFAVPIKTSGPQRL
jgi:hypothetical protein